MINELDFYGNNLYPKWIKNSKERRDRNFTVIETNRDTDFMIGIDID